MKSSWVEKTSPRTHWWGWWPICGIKGDSKFRIFQREQEGSKRGGRGGRERGAGKFDVLGYVKSAVQGRPQVGPPWQEEGPEDQTLVPRQSHTQPRATGWHRSEQMPPEERKQSLEGSAFGSHGSSLKWAKMRFGENFTLSLFSVHLLPLDFLQGKSLPWTSCNSVHSLFAVLGDVIALSVSPKNS